MLVNMEGGDESGRRSRGQTPDRLDATVTTKGGGGGRSNPHSRRGSHLLVAAGIGIEQRRKLSQQNAEAHGKVFQRGNQVFIEDKDGNVTRLEVVEVHEKMGLLRKSVPTLPLFFAIIFCLLNTILPGTGTILGALSLFCCGKCRHEKVSRGVKYGFVAAILQIVTAVFIVGWIYSIYYGVTMVQDSLLKGAGATVEPISEDVENNKNNTDPSQHPQST